jgi:hypothetical protein
MANVLKDEGNKLMSENRPLEAIAKYVPLDIFPFPFAVYLLVVLHSLAFFSPLNVSKFSPTIWALQVHRGYQCCR